MDNGHTGVTEIVYWRNLLYDIIILYFNTTFTENSFKICISSLRVPGTVGRSTTNYCTIYSTSTSMHLAACRSYWYQVPATMLQSCWKLHSVLGMDYSILFITNTGIIQGLVPVVCNPSKVQYDSTENGVTCTPSTRVPGTCTKNEDVIAAALSYAVSHGAIFSVVDKTQ
jgi:hypothetical protein